MQHFAYSDAWDAGSGLWLSEFDADSSSAHPHERIDRLEGVGSLGQRHIDSSQAFGPSPACMLAALPVDILLASLECLHADARLLSRLDIAFCSHSVRASIISVLCLVQSIGSLGVHSTDGVSYLTWVVARQVRVDRLIVDPHDIVELNKCLLFTTLSTVSWVNFVDRTPEDHSVLDPRALRQFLQHLPNLSHINCRGWKNITDYQVMAFRVVGNLTQLDLEGCPDVYGPTVCSLRLWPLLRLAFDAVDNQAWNILATSCHSLLAISLCCSGLVEEAHIRRFFLNNPRLKNVTLECNYAEMNFSNELMQSIATNSLQLVSFKCIVAYDLDIVLEQVVLPATIQLFLTNCPNMLCLLLCNVEIALSMSSMSSGKRAGHINCLRQCELEFVYELCLLLDIPLIGFSSRGNTFPPDNQLLLLMADKFGNDLEMWSCFNDWQPGDAVLDTGIVEYFLSHCPSLKTLAFFCPSGISDNILSQLPIWCPKLSDLMLCREPLLSDDRLFPLLLGLQSRPFAYLTLRTCPLLTDVMLVRIAELFPKLTLLDVISTPFTKESMLAVIASGKLRAQIIGFQESDWVAGVLRVAGVNNIPKFL